MMWRLRGRQEGLSQVAHAPTAALSSHPQLTPLRALRRKRKAASQAANDPSPVGLNPLVKKIKETLKLVPARASSLPPRLVVRASLEAAYKESKSEVTL
jgi:hypothetical protein